MFIDLSDYKDEVLPKLLSKPLQFVLCPTSMIIKVKDDEEEKTNIVKISSESSEFESEERPSLSSTMTRIPV